MPEEVARALLNRLWEIQAEQGLSNRRLAIEVGIHPSSIGRMKRGLRGSHLPLATAMKMVTRFPELAVFLTAVSPIITSPERISEEAGGEQRQ